MRWAWAATRIPIAAALLTMSGSVAPDLLRGEDLPSQAGLEPEVATTVPLRVVPLRLGALRPGVTHRLDVEVQNTNARSVVMTGVRVRVRQVSSPRATARRPCGLIDFRTRAGTFAGFALAPGATASLTEAGVAHEYWPRIEMVDRATNQDGCQGARLTLEVVVEGRMR